MAQRRVAVIGGGVSGLATAYYLQKLAAENKIALEVSLFEASGRLGGAIETEEVDGFLLEKGPDAFITDKPWALSLSKELGLESELIPTNTAHRGSFISKEGKLLPVPEGFYLTAPLNAQSFLASPLISWPGKLRMMAEIFIPKKSNPEDESIASFVRRRFGREALDRVAQAMIGGIYTGDPETLSLQAAMPRFFELEQKYGSLTRGLLAEAKNKNTSFEKARGPRYSLFVSFRKGMKTLTDALANQIPPTAVKMKQKIQSISKDLEGGSWRVHLEGGHQETFDAVCVTTKASHAANFFCSTIPELSQNLSQITYESVATLNLAYRREQISHKLNGFGFVLPKTEGKALMACSFSSQKFEARAPKDQVLLRAFVGGAFGRLFYAQPDEALCFQAEKELAQYLGIQGQPALRRLQRYPEAMVQYRIGHHPLVSKIRQIAKNYPGLALAGSCYDGVGIPDCIRQAESQARSLIQFLGERKS